MGDEKYYQIVEDELNGKPRKYTDRALMKKAEVLSGGDEQETRYKYIQLRVEQFKEAQIEREKTEEEKRRVKSEKERAKQQLEEQETQQKEKKSMDFWVVWGAFIAAIVAYEYLKILPVISIALGFGVYKYLTEITSATLLNSILAALAVTFLSYFTVIFLIFLGVGFFF